MLVSTLIDGGDETFELTFISIDDCVLINCDWEKSHDKVRKFLTKYTMSKKTYSVGLLGQTNSVFVEGGTKVVEAYFDEKQVKISRDVSIVRVNTVKVINCESFTMTDKKKEKILITLFAQVHKVILINKRNCCNCFLLEFFFMFVLFVIEKKKKRI